MLYMVTFTINIPQMLAYIPAPWILWAIKPSAAWHETNKLPYPPNQDGCKIPHGKPQLLSLW